jgi:hypothetical protein
VSVYAGNRHMVNGSPPRGFFAVGVDQPKCEINIGTLWRTAHILGAAYLFTIGKRYRRQPSDTTKRCPSGSGVDAPSSDPLGHR